MQQTHLILSVLAPPSLLSTKKQLSLFIGGRVRLLPRKRAQFDRDLETQTQLEMGNLSILPQKTFEN